MEQIREVAGDDIAGMTPTVHRAGDAQLSSRRPAGITRQVHVDRHRRATLRQRRATSASTCSIRRTASSLSFELREGGYDTRRSRRRHRRAMPRRADGHRRLAASPRCGRVQRAGDAATASDAAALAAGRRAADGRPPTIRRRRRPDPFETRRAADQPHERRRGARPDEQAATFDPATRAAHRASCWASPWPATATADGSDQLLGCCPATT